MAREARWVSASGAGVRRAAGFVLARPERTRGRVGEAVGVGVGESAEFLDFREYEPGDDLRRIDWGAFARSDKLVVRRHREEVRPVLEVLVDGTRSMDLGATGKGETALALAAACVDAGRRSGFAAAGWKCTARGVERVEVMESWGGFDGATGAAPSWRGPGEARGGVRVVVSDLLVPEGPESVVMPLCAGVRWLVVVQVLAREDIEGPAPGPYRLRDRETGEEVSLEIDANESRAHAARARAFVSSCRDACRRARATHALVVTDGWSDEGPDLSALTGAGVLVAR